MTDAALLLAAVRAHPEEDTPRLIYADAIEETDPARAEFIRLHLSPDFMDRRRKAFRRWKALAWQLYPEFFCLFGAWGDYLMRKEWQWNPADDAEWFENPRVLFDRGFITAFNGTAAHWLEHGDRLCAEHPVTRVTLTTPARVQCAIKPDAVIYTVTADRRSRTYRVPGTGTLSHPLGASVGEMLGGIWTGITFELPTTRIPFDAIASLLEAGIADDFANPGDLFSQSLPTPYAPHGTIPPVE
jgi:uncharacterized protein (TIGR02996 family)